MTPAISIRQPWAAALLCGIKDIENRTRPLPPKYVNKPLLLHAGKAQPRPGEWSGLLFERAMQSVPLLYGGIIGEITFGPSVQDHPSEWGEPGYWHWPVVRVRALEFWQCRGMLGVFNVNCKDIFIGPHREAIQVLPKDEDYVNAHPYCLHLWAEE